MLGVILAILAAILFGISTGMQKYSLERISKFSIRKMLFNKKWFSSLIVGGIGILFYLFAMRIAELSLVQSIISLTLIVQVLIGFAFFKEKLGVIEWLAIIMVVAGVLLIAY